MQISLRVFILGDNKIEVNIFFIFYSTAKNKKFITKVK